MKYTVVWIRWAEDAYVKIWRQASDHAAIWSAAQEIDALLESNPHDAGESRSGDERILLKQPLGVLFLVDQDQPIVRVLWVWRTDRRLRP